MSKRIIGQDIALAALRSAMRTGRFHHAWILAGPRGVGKCTTAVELAKVLLDPEGDLAALGLGNAANNNVQHMVDAGMHPDLHVIRKELALYSESAAVRNRKQMNIPIDVLREHMLGGDVGKKHQEAAAYRTSALGHGKVFIIDEAELLAREAQNTMLKTLEEPPARTYIFLVTAHPERLYPTILSRCQQVRFHRLDDAAMQQWAAEALADIPAQQRKWILQFAQGSPGMALRAVQFGFERWQLQLEPMLDTLNSGDFPLEMGKLLGDLVEQYAEQWVKNNTNASKDAANKDGCGVLLSLLGLHARTQMLNAATADDGDLTERWTIVIDLLRESELQMRSNVNHKLALENLVAQWASAMRGEIAMV